MPEVSTLAMQDFSDPETRERSGPGFLLLYAEEHRRLPAAWPLNCDQAVLGREGSLAVPVPSVSRRHAEVLRSGERWLLRDLGSRNGLIVDGQRIAEVELEPLHEVRLGDVVLKFVERDVDAYARFRIDGGVDSHAEGSGTRDASALIGGLQVRRLAARLERAAVTTLSVLLLGETGTGKEVAAREVHRVSGAKGPFVAINCAAVPGTLLESELFGYRRGAFSGADRDKPGLIQSAEGGTLFLDEIGDMPLDAQAKLLRVLQTREVTPLGATRPERVDVRIVSATHQNLRAQQTTGRFRADLYARLNEYQVVLPPLRERKEDLFLLVRTFLARHATRPLTPSFRFMAALLHYDWPYNVRELEAAVRRGVALAETDRLDVAELPPEVEEAMQGYGAPRESEAPGAEASAHARRPDRATPPTEPELRALLQRHAGNVAAVGRELGKARMQIHRWMERYGVEPEDFRGRAGTPTL